VWEKAGSESYLVSQTLDICESRSKRKIQTQTRLRKIAWRLLGDMSAWDRQVEIEVRWRLPIA
jgi:hypothetical protein